MTDKDFGINLIGYIRSEHGVGESARHVATALDKTDYAWSIYDFEINNNSRQEDHSWDYKINEEIKYPIIVLNINADQIPVVKKHIPLKVWDNSYKIGIWYWELEEFPERWIPSTKLIDEVWAPTRFIQEAVSMKAVCPVLHMPLPMTLQKPENICRKQFGLPENAFLFLNMYDTLSIQSRKNPTAAIKAFKNAFHPNDLSVGLVIKLNNPTFMEEDLQTLKTMIGEYQNIYILPMVLTRLAVNALIATCDVAISLHRSEGLGLLCQEAMYLGKPVIATNWSGNIDFMSEKEACMVDYKLVPIGTNIGPYEAWQRWADVDIKSAANYMQKLYSNREFGEILGKKAQKRIMTEYSPEVCGDRMKKRLQFIQHNVINI